MTTDLLPPEIHELYEVHEWKHACAVLSSDFPEEWGDIIKVLLAFRLPLRDIAAEGKNKSLLSRALERAFVGRGWREKAFETRVTVDGTAIDSRTHKVDCYKNRVALEIEWNNKDPFYERDLNGFRLLFDLRAISVGVIVTRCDELQDVFNALGKGKSYGSSTTHMSKLLPRLHGGSGGGCPILVFGMRRALCIGDDQYAL